MYADNVHLRYPFPDLYVIFTLLVKMLKSTMVTILTKKDVPSNVKLVKPFEGFCLKTKKIYKNLSQKVYVNMCSYDGIQKPFLHQENKTYWNVPFLLNKSRNDQDDKGDHVLVFDVVFHSEAIIKANSEMRFKKLVCDSAINGINDNVLKEKNEKVSSDYKILTKFNYKGKEVSYINIHSLDKSEFANKMLPAENYKTEVQKEIDTLKNKTEEIKEEDEEEKQFDRIDVEKPNEFLENASKVIQKKEISQPKYTLKYYDEIELHNYFYDPNNQGVKPYTKLSIDILTPLMESLDKQAFLDINSRLLVFKYKDIYELNLNLPTEIDVDKCRAKFDKSRKLLNITCSILYRKIEGNSLNNDPHIEEIYEENNKIIDKKAKIEEVTVKPEESVKIGNKETDLPKISDSQQTETNIEKRENEPLDQNIHNNIDAKAPKGEFLEIDDINQENLKNNIKVHDEVENENIPDKIKLEEIKSIEVIIEKKEKNNDSILNIIEDENVNKKNFIQEDEIKNNQSIHNPESSKKDEVTKIYYMNLSCSLIYEIE